MTRTSEQVVIGLIGIDSATVHESLVSAIEAAGATPEVCTEATAITKGAVVDAIIFDAGSAPERLVPIAATLGSDPRTRWLPRVVIVQDDTTAAQIAPFGAATIVLSTSTDAMGVAVADVVEQVRARTEAEVRARTDNAERRTAEQTIASIKNDGVTLSHDARVLFGVILGFASNLRDGFAGPITEQQRGHLVNIIEASSDAASLLDRYVTALCRSIEAHSGEASRSMIPRVQPRRRHNDLSDLVRGTVALFEGVAEAKRIRLRADAPRATPAWCDAMQIKQALVNLLANALKFTPAGASVDVVARMGPPASVRGGATSRRDVELVVIDTGPGIPEGDRGRVFERGVRLERDRERPGTGIGLAVVRDVVDQHGGVVRVEETPGGGASFVLTLPADLRARSADRRVANGSVPAPVHVVDSNGQPEGATK